MLVFVPNRLANISLVIMCVFVLLGCTTLYKSTPDAADISSSTLLSDDYVMLKTPTWARNANIYQLNTRQFTPEGTFQSAQNQLPRLKNMGVKILWLMPIHEIGKENRKGTLGSPYSVKDYYSVNSEFGTKADFRAFVQEAHRLGFKVMLDWVANHTAWDNQLRFDNPDWYDKDHDGNFRPTPWWDWSDIIDLDFRHPDVHAYMIDAMKYWVKEFNIDGYRADVAGFVPVSFWDNVRAELESIKPVFMLAEWESRDLHQNAFDMTYAWSWYEAVNHVVKYQDGLGKLYVYYSWNESAFPKKAYRMTYVANHDSNAWEGTAIDKLGAALPAVYVLSVVGEGMPLVYNGLEAGNNKALAFFEKDPIDWQSHSFEQLITRSNNLLAQNSALWHGEFGATMVKVDNTKPEHILSFVRANADNKVLAVFNFSDSTSTFSLNGSLVNGAYQEYFTEQALTLNENELITLPPWGYKVLIAQ